jgi:hypothetical protein
MFHRSASALIAICAFLVISSTSSADDKADTEEAGGAAAMLQGRVSAESRQTMTTRYGGNAASEAAVAAALKWLACVQYPDGGWSFDHRLAPSPAARMSDHPGSLVQARTAATAMALLPFLGAGQTHTDGKYKPTVNAGLRYLMTRADRRGSMHEPGGSMYSHGLGAIALCEAYALTHDRKLERPAQASLDFIKYAQDPVGGGWRYAPRQPGDTSVCGWQLMALKSGHAAFLRVHPETVRKTTGFLDSVQAIRGAYYGYTTPGRRPSTSAIGLLCRIYLGWQRDHQALREGVEYVSSEGPSKTDMYYNFFATQLMYQYGGKHWDAWNAVMRDQLVATQQADGPAKGSWYYAGGHGAERGGRLYNTSLATMILQVYYRHTRVFDKPAPVEGS